jgi:hypothetical protein
MSPFIVGLEIGMAIGRILVIAIQEIQKASSA